MKFETNQFEIRKKEELIKLDNNECELWKKFKNGDKEAFAQLFRNYYRPLCKYGLNIYADYDFINDSIQEMFLEFWQYRQTIGDVNSVKFYIIKCFKRKVLRNLETVRKKETSILKDSYNKITTSSFESELIREQTEDQKKYYIIKELKGLSRRQQEAIFLKFYQDLSYDEICSIMSLNYQSVKNLIHNSVKSLREKLLLKDIFTGVIPTLLFICF